MLDAITPALADILAAIEEKTGGCGICHAPTDWPASTTTEPFTGGSKKNEPAQIASLKFAAEAQHVVGR